MSQKFKHPKSVRDYMARVKRQYRARKKAEKEAEKQEKKGKS
jgi:hypothetical protein